MKFAVYKLNFAAGVHLGTGTLVSGANTLPADTLFSALCMEAAQQGEKSIKTLVDAVRQNRLRIGDLFPFIGEELYGKVKYTICRGQIVYTDEEEKNES